MFDFTRHSPAMKGLAERNPDRHYTFEVAALTKKGVKRGLLRAARVSRLFSLIGSSAWRRNRLLILCYHGISLEDEHQWNPALYMAPEELDRRFSLVTAAGCRVLPFTEAIDRLYAGSLPPRSVAITFDDGTYDFYRKAVPVLQKHGFP